MKNCFKDWNQSTLTSIWVGLLQHGNMGVLVSELQDELDETGIINSIPEDRLDLLIARADRDGDSYVTFDEFINLVGDFNVGIMGGSRKLHQGGLTMFCFLVIYEFTEGRTDLLQEAIEPKGYNFFLRGVRTSFSKETNSHLWFSREGVSRHPVPSAPLEPYMGIDES